MTIRLNIYIKYEGQGFKFNYTRRNEMNVFQMTGFAKSTVVSIKLLYKNNACGYTRNPVFTANKTAGLLI